MVDPGLYSTDAKQNVRAATTGEIVLAGLQTVDGVVLKTLDRVLVKNQSNPSLNGIYRAKVGPWNRAPDADTRFKVSAGMTVLVTEGSQALKQFVLVTPDPVILGIDPLNFQMLTGAPGVGDDVAYIHTQSIPSDTWVIHHGLNKFPSVTIVDSTNTEVIADIHHISTLQCEVSFSSPQTGTAYLN